MKSSPRILIRELCVFKNFILCVLLAAILICSAQAGPRFQYNLYKNSENFGIVVFPPPEKNSELEQIIHLQGFQSIETGNAVFRYGSKGKNGTYMMPEDVQKEHLIQKFIIVQMLSQSDFMIGVFDPEWGLTLPQFTYLLKDLKKNIPKTLRIFRGDGSNRRET